MKKIIALASVAALAAVAFGAVSQKAKAPLGVDNIAFGYGAGIGSTGASTNVVVIGTDAGAYGADNTNCVYIGAEAGRGRTGKTGEVILGDVLYHTNGVTTIKGFSGGGSIDTNKVVTSFNGMHGDVVYQGGSGGTATNLVGTTSGGNAMVVELNETKLIQKFDGNYNGVYIRATHDGMSPINMKDYTLFIDETNKRIDLYNGSTKIGSITLQ